VLNIHREFVNNGDNSYCWDIQLFPPSHYSKLNKKREKGDTVISSFEPIALKLRYIMENTRIWSDSIVWISPTKLEISVSLKNLWYHHSRLPSLRCCYLLLCCDPSYLIELMGFFRGCLCRSESVLISVSYKLYCKFVIKYVT
jgi:hypothetical protein